MYYLSLYCFFVVFFRFVLLLCITGLQVDFFKIKVLMLNEKHACSTAATYVEEIFSIESLLRPESSVQEENLTQLNLFSYEFVGTVSVPLIPRNTLSFCLLLLTQPPDAHMSIDSSIKCQFFHTFVPLNFEKNPTGKLLINFNTSILQLRFCCYMKQW